MAGEVTASSLESLPMHLLLDWLGTCNTLRAVDLAMLECVSYSFRRPTGLPPCRSRSTIEAAAYQRCQRHTIFERLSENARKQVFLRCHGSWKRVLHFLLSLGATVPGFPAEQQGQAQISAGSYSTAIIDAHGMLYTFGEGMHEEPERMANSPEYPRWRAIVPPTPSINNTPARLVLPAGTRAVHVSANYHHAAVISSTGQLFTFGRDRGGACLGHGLEGGTPVAEPKLVTALEGICCKQVSTGLRHAVVLSTDGSVYTFGGGDFGRLGHGDSADQPQPRLVQALKDIGPMAHVSAGAAHTFAVSEAGVVYAFGHAGHGRLGLGNDRDDQSIPVPISFFVDNSIFIVAAIAGDEHSVAIDSAGKVYVWGSGYCGALGNRSEMPVLLPILVEDLQRHRVVQVAARRRKTFFVTDEGLVFVTGWKAGGSLGIPPEHSNVPNPAMENQNQALARIEKIMHPQRCEALANHHIVQVSTGMYHSVAITREGNFLSFGDNDKGQLGLGDTIGAQVNSATQVTLL